MQRPSGPGTAFSIDSLIGTPQPRPGHLLYTGYPMFMPYRPLVIPQALSHSPLPSAIPPLAPLASFAGRLTNTFCASLGQGMPSMVALTTTLPGFSEPADGFYPPQEITGPRLSADAAIGRQESPHEELHARDKAAELLNFSETFQSVAGESNNMSKPQITHSIYSTRVDYCSDLKIKNKTSSKWVDETNRSVLPHERHLSSDTVLQDSSKKWQCYRK